MTTKTRLLSLVVAICLIVSAVVCMVGCTEEEAPITISSYTTDLTYTVGAEFAPTVTITKSDDTTATLTLATNPAIELPIDAPNDYKTILKLVEDADGKLVYSEAGEYTLNVLYCGKQLTLNFTIEEEE